MDAIRVFLKKRLHLCIPAAAGILVVLYGILNHGSNITHDSVAYIFGAKSLLEGSGLLYFGYGTPIIQWPPLYPVILASGRVLGMDLTAFAGYLNAFVFGSIVYFSGVLFQRYIKNTAFVVLGLIAIVLSAPLLNVSVSVWSEPLFILFIILFLLQMERYVEEGSLRSLCACALFGAGACMTRYAGVTVIAAGALVMLLRRDRLWRKLGHACLFGFMASFPLALWLLRNFFLSGTFTGGRSPSQVTLTQNLGFTISTITEWFMPVSLLKEALKSGRALYIAVAVILVVICFLLAIIYVDNRRKNAKGEAVLPEGWLIRISPVILFTVVYIGYLVASASMVAFDRINDRLLSPVSVPLILLAFVVIDYVKALSYNFLHKTASGLLLIVVLTACIAYPLVKAAAFAERMHASGAGLLASQRWSDSPVIEYLKKEAGNCTIYSDNPDAIYMYTGIDARYTPKKSGIELYSTKGMKEAVRTGKQSLIAWFSPVSSPGLLYNVEELKEFFEIEPLEQFPDGIVYRITGIKN